MNQQHSLTIWLAISVIIVGIGSLLLLGIQPQTTAAGAVVNGGGLLAQTAPMSTTLPAALTPFTNPTVLTETTALTTALPAPTFTAIAPLVLPNVPVPDGGQAYLLTPIGPEAVGWVQDQDEAANHFGDYNIYAGFFGGQQRVGAMQFDLSTVPPGSPILYADLTVTGLADEWLADNGMWTANLLAEWIDKDWAKQNFHWFARPDSALVALEPQLGSADVAVGQSNTFFLPPAALVQLEARLFRGRVSFRITGPTSGDDNLFAWDSGFGARTTGRGPVLRVVTGGAAPIDAPSPTPDYVVITLTPTDDRAMLAQAAERMTATAVAPPNMATGTPVPTVTATPFPPNWVTPVIVTNTPVPENGATAAWQAQVATAQAIVRGTLTATPPNVWTATSTPLPTATPMIVAYDRLTPTATPTPTPGALPSVLAGKILFWSDRTGNDRGSLMIMNPDGSNVALWTGADPEWAYAQARLNQDMSPDGGYRVVVSSEQIRTSQLWIIDLNDRTRRQLTNFDAIAYDPVWAPAGNRIAFVSPESGNDELYVINVDGTGLTQLTANDWEWDKYPSWSPDGQQIVFWSNRETRRKQIWIMNVDGSNVRNLSNSQYNDWEPVWVK